MLGRRQSVPSDYEQSHQPECKEEETTWSLKSNQQPSQAARASEVRQVSPTVKTTVDLTGRERTNRPQKDRAEQQFNCWREQMKERVICAPMSIAAQFTIAQIRNQPRVH